MKRRAFIRNTSILAAGALALPRIAYAAPAGDEAQLIYLSPIKSDGALSSCQAEVWFAQDAADMYVVTAHDAWRAQAVKQGLSKTQVWVGDVGQWRGSSGAYKKLPALTAVASQISEPSEYARLLPKFGAKYTREWGTYGPRFKNGLADGSRVLLRYRPV